MHEMVMVEKALDMILDECEGRGVSRVTGVTLTIGELMDVVDELVPSLFEYMARGTICEGAELVIKHVPAYVQCHKCHEAWHIDVRDQSTWTCPRCGAFKNYRMVSGREFKIDSIEVEMGVPEAEAQGAPATGEGATAADAAVESVCGGDAVKGGACDAEAGWLAAAVPMREPVSTVGVEQIEA